MGKLFFKTKYDPKKVFFLVDISSFIFRAFFALPPFHTKKGEPTNALYGVLTMLLKLIEEAHPNFLAIVADSKTPTFRHELYEAYKSNRSEPPEELKPQFDFIFHLFSILKLSIVQKDGFEADDWIASLTKWWTQKGSAWNVVIVSSDKDLMQLVSPQVVLWDTMRDQLFDQKRVEEKFGVLPKQLRDWLALVGDSSDAVPGVPGIGKKTATQLLQSWNDLEQVVRAAKEGKWKRQKLAQNLLENQKQLRLSQELVTLKEMPIKGQEKDFLFQLKVTNSFLVFLKRFEFFSILKKWEKFLPSASQKEGGAQETSSKVFSSKENPPPSYGSSIEIASEKGTFQGVFDERNFLKLLEKIDQKGRVSFDLETTSLDPHQAQIVGWAFCFEDKKAYYVPVGHQDGNDQLPAQWVLEKCTSFLKNPRIQKLGQNLKYDTGVLWAHGIATEGIYADTMLGAYLLDPESKVNLDILSQKYLQYTPISYETLCGKGKNEISFAQVSVEKAIDYAAEDAWCVWKLWPILKKELKEKALLEVFFKMEVPLLTVLMKMEHEGISVDLKWLDYLRETFGQKLLKIEKKINHFAHGTVNLNSPKQLQKLLFEDLALPVQTKTKTGFSTDANVLKALAPLHEIPRLLLEYREIAKLLNTYILPLPELVNPKTGRVHTTFHQTITATGRLSSSKPNLQNIPVRTEQGAKIRKVFHAERGKRLLSVDYSQIELRLLAHLSQDRALVDAFKKGEDIHLKTASDIFSCSMDQLTSKQRQFAKAINFGLMYGKTAFGLAKELGISRTEAKTWIERYFSRYRGVKAYFEKTIEEARERGWVQSLWGRRRFLPQLHSQNKAVRAFSERMAMNTPIQGTAADLMKLAMIEVDRFLEKKRTRLLVQVHDELLFEGPKEEIKELSKKISHLMTHVQALAVPLTVHVLEGKHWGELSK